jgi:hypothetical protein
MCTRLPIRTLVRRVMPLLVFSTCGVAAETPPAPASRWELGDGVSTRWEVARDSRLPHKDFIEQGGRRVAQVVNYAVGADRTLAVDRTVVWPGLRTSPNHTCFNSLQKSYGAEAEPTIAVDGAALGPIRLNAVVLDGTLTFRGEAAAGIEVARVTFPSLEAPAALDRWTLRNTRSAPVTIAVAPLALCAEVRGPFGVNLLEVTHDAPPETRVAPGQALSFAVAFAGRLPTAPVPKFDAAAEEAARRGFIAGLNQALRLETPEPVLDREFAFAKWRVAESINDTRGGMMLAPGGLRYYASTWCNDNVEYAGPFFPFLGERGGNQASLNTYRLYLPFMAPSYQKIPGSIVAEGQNMEQPGGDRGDAAMYAYGAARFCLARGDRAIAEELWRGIAWCLEYCRRMQTPEGVVASDSDELEGRLPTGKANLSTSSLYYGGLRSAAHLARALGKAIEAEAYDARAEAMAQAIEAYFGATVEGYRTYRYYDTNTVLRSWICLPLCMGLTNRAEGTVKALFSARLWTPDGLACEAGETVFWDRSTLYAFRGVFQSGETARGMEYLLRYTHRRLCGDHVPYPVEAYPEGGQAHLASESGLYCRIFTEGLFGLLPTGLDRFTLTPRLPDGWPRMALRSVRAFGRDFDVVIARANDGVRVQVLCAGSAVCDRVVARGASAQIVLPGNPGVGG